MVPRAAIRRRTTEPPGTPARTTGTARRPAQDGDPRFPRMDRARDGPASHGDFRHVAAVDPQVGLGRGADLVDGHAGGPLEEPQPVRGDLDDR